MKEAGLQKSGTDQQNLAKRYQEHQKKTIKKHWDTSLPTKAVQVLMTFINENSEGCF